MNRLRFRSGQVHLRKARVAAETVISAGDLLWLDDGEARPASAFPWEGDLETTQAAFAAAFLGVAHQPSAAGDVHPVSVDVSPDSVYEFDCPPAAYSLGQPLGPDELTGGLLSQQLEAAAATSAVARAAEFTGAGATSVRVTFASAFHTSSANAHAALGTPETVEE